MVFRNIFLSVGLTLLFSIAFTGEKTHAQVPHKFKVHVNVNCDDEDNKSLMQSYIKRELRSLGDVLIVGPGDALFILTIVTVESTYPDTGAGSGDIATGVMFLSKTPDGDYYYPNLLVCSHNTEHLERVCKDLVAKIDTQEFEPIR